MERKPYTIRRGEQHMPQEQAVDLLIHGGPRLQVLRNQDYVVDLTADQVRQLEADGYVVSDLSGKAAQAAQPVATDSTLPPWPLATPPADYIAQHANDTDPSPAVAERLTLAQRHVDAAGEE